MRFVSFRYHSNIYKNKLSVQLLYLFLNKSLVLTKAAFIWSKIQLNRNIVKYYYNK